MPPCVVSANNAEGKKAVSALQLSSLRAAIPAEAFVKSLPRSLFYLARDYGVWLGAIYLMAQLRSSETWAQLPFLAQAAVSLAYWNVAGFFMWALFVVGHDCGHTTFSDFDLVNDAIGLLTHGSILVPYFPWQMSHRRHHMYHNHLEKDYSHPWYTAEKLSKPEEHMGKMVDDSPLLRLIFPYIGWPIYLIGMPDGSHFLPISFHRMWKETPLVDYFKCLLSTAVVLAYAALIYRLCGGDLLTVAYYYGVPYVIFGWWLVTVTYLQHHDHDTHVYEDDSWTFVDAAFETIDRTYGLGIDSLHHNITDCHVVHHLFFTKIPHYNLPLATRALRSYLEQNELGWMYKHVASRDFFLRVHEHFLNIGFKTKRSVLSKQSTGMQQRGHMPPAAPRRESKKAQ